MNTAEYPLRHDLVNNSDLYESVSDEMLSIMQRSFLVRRKISTVYNERHMNNAMLLCTVLDTFATGCMNGVKKACDRNMKKILDKISKQKMPSSEWLHRIFASMTSGSSIDVFDAEVQRTHVMMYNVWVVLNLQDAMPDPKRLKKWDGSPDITQTEMKICILLYVLQSFLLVEDREKTECAPLEEKRCLTLEKIPAG